MATVTGAAAIAQVFRRMSADSRRRVEAALTLSGDEVVARARALAPVGDDDSDRLRDAIMRTEPRLTRRREADAGVAVYVMAGTTAETAEYARAQEFGRAPSDDHPGHAAQPFLFPAYLTVRRRVRGRIARALAQAARRAASGG